MEVAEGVQREDGNECRINYSECGNIFARTAKCKRGKCHEKGPMRSSTTVKMKLKRLGIFREKEHATDLNAYDFVMHLQEKFLEKNVGFVSVEKCRETHNIWKN
jgi:hypothetical protein